MADCVVARVVGHLRGMAAASAWHSAPVGHAPYVELGPYWCISASHFSNVSTGNEHVACGGFAANGGCLGITFSDTRPCDHMPRRGRARARARELVYLFSIVLARVHGRGLARIFACECACVSVRARLLISCPT